MNKIIILCFLLIASPCYAEKMGNLTVTNIISADTITTSRIISSDVSYSRIISADSITVISGLEIPNGDAPDASTQGEIAIDTDGWLRAHDGTAEKGMPTNYTIQFTIAQPDDLDETDDIPVWYNTTGMTFHITAIYAWCDDQAGDDGAFTLVELDDPTDFGTETQINDGAITIATDGTEVDSYTDTSINATYDDIEDGNLIVYDPSASDLKWVKVVIKGYFLGDVD